MVKGLVECTIIKMKYRSIKTGSIHLGIKCQRNLNILNLLPQLVTAGGLCTTYVK